MEPRKHPDAEMKSPSQIATELEIPPSRIYNMMHNGQIPSAVQHEGYWFVNEAETLTKLDASGKLTLDRMKGAGSRRYSKAEKKLAREMYREGKTYAQIGRALRKTRPGTTELGAAEFVRRNKWKRAKRPKAAKGATPKIDRAKLLERAPHNLLSPQPPVAAMNGMVPVVVGHQTFRVTRDYAEQLVVQLCLGVKQ